MQSLSVLNLPQVLMTATRSNNFLMKTACAHPLLKWRGAHHFICMILILVGDFNWEPAKEAISQVDLRYLFCWLPRLIELSVYTPRAQINALGRAFHFICCLIQRVHYTQLACVYYLHQSIFYFTRSDWGQPHRRVTLYETHMQQRGCGF